MKGKFKYTLINLILALSLSLCASDEDGDKGTGADEADQQKKIDLASELKTPGNNVSLPSTGSGSKNVNGIVIDANVDGEGDGIDLSGDGEGDIIYGTLSASGKTSKTNVISFAELLDKEAEAFYLVGGNKNYYFVSGGTEIEISTTVYQEDAGVRLVVALDQSLEGLDTSGDGDADDTNLTTVALTDVSLGGSCTVIQTFEGTVLDEYCFSFDDGSMVDALQSLCSTPGSTFNEGEACNLDGAVGTCYYTIFQVIEVYLQYGSTYSAATAETSCLARPDSTWEPPGL
jgi:hypothetical protein